MKRTLSLLILLILMNTTIHAEKVYVFVPSTSSPKMIQKNLSKQVSGEILSFSKLKDFLKQVKKDKPAAVITRKDVLEKLPEYQVKLEGYYKDSSSQKFYAINSTGFFTPTSKTKVGVVDYLGGKQMNEVTTTIVGTKTKVKKVKKFKDLLPLLSMNMVDAIIIAESEIEVFKASSSQDLKEIALPYRVEGYVVFATSTSTKIEEEMKLLTKKENLSMGVESWR